MAVNASLDAPAVHGAWRAAMGCRRRRARGTGGGLAIALTLAAAPMLHAQEPAPPQAPHGPTSRPWLVTTAHYGKWATLAGAAGLIAVSAVRRGEANDAQDRLEGFCRQDFARCEIVGDRYVDEMAEAIFQEHADLDRKAQGLLIGGQATLVISGAMFLIDLMWDDDETENIPFTPLRVWSEPGRVGLSMAF